MNKRVINLVDADNSHRPISDSENGKTNALSHHCDIVMHSKNYATCLHLVKERDSSRLDALYSDCSIAISKKRCPALAMRYEEVEAGHAIYFRERIKHLGDSFINTASILMNGVSNKVSDSSQVSEKIIKSPVTKKDSFQPSMGGYADAINNSLKNGEIPIEIAEPKKSVKEIVAIEGESLIDLAKRMMANAK